MKPSGELTIRERAVLFALLAEARQLSNPDLAERIGFRLDGRERRKLNDLKLVDSEKRGRAYAHELSDSGWRWCAEELAAGTGGRGSSMERALYAVLGGLDRYLRASGRSLADVFAPDPDADADATVGAAAGAGVFDGAAADWAAADAAARIEAGYRELTPVPGEFVRLRDLRLLLAEIARPAVDAALAAMYADRRINLIPQSNQRTLTDADHESALRIGGEFKHLISIER